jgi:hypothetical protein
MTYEVQFISRDGEVLKSVQSSRRPNMQNITSPLLAVRKLIFKNGKLIEMGAVVGRLQIC